MKLEVVVLSVADVDRAKEFYQQRGWRLDADFAGGDDYRVIQFTPPGSGCSIIFGKNVTAAALGSARGIYLIVTDVEAACRDLRARGVAISEPFHDAAGQYAGPDEPYLFGRLRVSGLDPERRTRHSYASFNDPDGNGWSSAQRVGAPARRRRRSQVFRAPRDVDAALRRCEKRVE